MFGTTLLPQKIKDHYNRIGASDEGVEAVVISRGVHNGERVETIQIESFDGTGDLWGWVRNEKSRDPRYPRHWALIDSGFSLDDEEIDPLEDEFDRQVAMAGSLKTMPKTLQQPADWPSAEWIAKQSDSVRDERRFDPTLEHNVNIRDNR